MKTLFTAEAVSKGGRSGTMETQRPGIARAQVQRIMDEAHKTCPYSKALPGDTSVKLVVD
jgi:organic hydroperoxide reductase OsmC/OhrA